MDPAHNQLISPPPSYVNLNAPLNSQPFAEATMPSAPTSNSRSPIGLTAETDTPLPPYLALPHLLSLTWLATPVISLVFVAIRLALSSQSAQNGVDDAKNSLLASCQAAETAATVAASLPRYMAEGTNKSIEDAVNSSMAAAKDILILCLQALEGIINFVVDTYRSTFLCFLELVVRGGLALLIGAVQEISTFITSSLNSIRSDIQSDVASANSVIASAVAGINKVTSVVGVNLNVPQFSIPSLDALQNVTIPTDFENALVSLNDSLPTLSQLRDTIDSLIDTPFTDMINDINSTFNGITFNTSVFAVPPQNDITFCNEMDLSVIDDLGQDLIKVVKIGIGLVVVLALVIVGINCAIQWYKWRCLMKHVRRTKQAWIEERKFSGMADDGMLTDRSMLSMLRVSEHPLITLLSFGLLKPVLRTPKARNNFRWFFAYIMHPPALACLLIGLGGILSVELQLLAIAPIEARYQGQIVSTVGNLTDTIAGHINSAVLSSSASYADSANTHILSIQNDIDNGMFGWVNTTTTAINSTVVAFYDDVVSIVNSTFGNTILASPMQEFVRCILGSKVNDIEEALTFIHNNAKVTLPIINANLLTLSNASIAEVTKPIADAAIGSGTPGTNQQTGVIGQLVDRYVETLIQERLMFSIFIVIWGIVVLSGIAILIWANWGEERVRQWKKRRWQKEKGLGANAWRNHPSEEAITEPKFTEDPESPDPVLTITPPAVDSLGYAYPSSAAGSPVMREDPKPRFLSQRKQTRFADDERGHKASIINVASLRGFAKVSQGLLSPGQPSESESLPRRSPHLPGFPSTDNGFTSRGAPPVPSLRVQVNGGPRSPPSSPPFNSYLPGPPSQTPQAAYAAAPRQLTPIYYTQGREPTLIDPSTLQSADPFGTPFDDQYAVRRQT